jgi:transcriptional regulator with XRE-family HTH domain
MGKKKSQQAKEASRFFGRNLAQYRKRSGLAQEGTADRAGLHRTHVAMIEEGKRLPRLDTIVKLAGAVGVEPCELLIGLAWDLEAPNEGRK